MHLSRFLEGELTNGPNGNDNQTRGEGQEVNKDCGTRGTTFTHPLKKKLSPHHPPS